MAEVPYQISDDNESDFYQSVLAVIRDINEERIGGASIGDVFHSPGDVLTLKVAENSGLYKNDDGELDIGITADCISNIPSGNITSKKLQDALNELDGQKLSADGSDVARFETVRIYNSKDYPFPPDYTAYFAPVLYGMGGVGMRFTFYDSAEENYLASLLIYCGGQWGGTNIKEWYTNAYP